MNNIKSGLAVVREEHLTHTSTVYYLGGEVDTQQDKSEGKARSSLCMCEANVYSQDQAQLTGDREVCQRPSESVWPTTATSTVVYTVIPQPPTGPGAEQCYYYSHPLLWCPETSAVCLSVENGGSVFVEVCPVTSSSNS